MKTTTEALDTPGKGPKQKPAKAEYPSTLAFMRRLEVSDGLMFNAYKTAKGVKAGAPVKVVRRGIRGVLGAEKAAGSGAGKGSVANIQVTEIAQTTADADGLLVTFQVTPLAFNNGIAACNSTTYREKLERFLDTAAGSTELTKLCQRYARNLLNGRWLWRNRLVGKTAVTVKWGTKTVSRTDSPVLNFTQDYSAAENQLAAALAEGFQNEGVAFTVEGFVEFAMPGSREVFPSQPMLNNKPKGFARALYKVNPLSASQLRDQSNRDCFTLVDAIETGDAAMTGSKLGNAIRTVDTWYGEEGTEMPAIAVEPNGANLDTNTFHRKTGTDAFAALKPANLDTMTAVLTKEKCSVEAQWNLPYLLAIIARGGVFGVASKEKDVLADDAQEAA